MALPQDGLRAALKPAGWKQGRVIAAADVAAIRDSFVSADCAFAWPPDPVVLVCSQTCDLIHDRLEAEPCVECVVGEFIEQPHPQKARNQNPRELDVAVIRDGQARYARFLMRRRVILPRELLLDRAPCAVTDIEPASLAIFVRWLRDRYARTALPDAFDRRIDNKARKKMEAALRQAPALLDLYIALNPIAELADGQEYSCSLLGAVSAQSREDPAQLQKAVDAVSKVAVLLGKCPGITMNEDAVKSEDEITLGDLRIFRRFGFEYLSLDDEAHAVPELNAIAN